MSYHPAYQLDQLRSGSPSSNDQIDPLEDVSVPIYTHNHTHPHEQHHTHTEQDDMPPRPRLRSMSSKGSKTNEPMNEEIILEDEVFQPVSQRGTEPVPNGEQNNKVEIAKTWYNLWGISNYGSHMLENNASVARDHVSTILISSPESQPDLLTGIQMANERTFLSWLRTSLGLTTAGVGVTQLFKIADKDDDNDFLVKVGKPIGATFICIAILCVVMGMMRFFKTQELLQEDKYPVARVSASILVFLVFAVCVATLVAVVHSA